MKKSVKKVIQWVDDKLEVFIGAVYGCFYNTSDSGAVPVFNSVSMDRRDDQVHVCMDGVHLHRVCGKDRGTYKDNICAFLTQAGPETVSGYFM